MITGTDPDDYKKVLMTDVEYEAYVEYYFSIDEATGDIVGERLTPYQAALLEKADQHNYGDLEEDFDESILILPDSFLET